MSPPTEHRIAAAPPDMYYIPDFISAEEETAILDKIPANRWVTLSHRRLQALPVRLTGTNTLLASPLPKWLLSPVVDRLHAHGVFADAPHGVNHCLINEYLPGQGIMPHEDGPAYHPVVATVSLGGSIVLEVTSKPSADTDTMDDRGAQTWRILQEPRSLLITSGVAYTDTLHGIAHVHEDHNLGPSTIVNWDLLGDPEAFAAAGGTNQRTTRISLTYRDVKKVSTLTNKIFGKSR